MQANLASYAKGGGNECQPKSAVTHATWQWQVNWVIGD